MRSSVEMSEEPEDQPTDAVPTTFHDQPAKQSGKRKRKSGIRPNPGAVVGITCGPIGGALAAHQSFPKSVATAVLASMFTMGLYLAWLYGPEWYARRIVSRHIYRPNDRQSR